MQRKMTSKTPVLDKGFISLFSSSLSNDELNELIIAFNLRQQEEYLCLPHIHMTIKCPLFVQLWLSKYQLHIVSTKRQNKEAYFPSEVEVAAKNLEFSKAIAADIKATTEALLINPKAYAFEGCDTHIAQIITPINVYNELMVSGSLDKWCSILKAQTLPKPIEEYQTAIRNILEAEWNILKNNV